MGNFLLVALKVEGAGEITSWQQAFVGHIEAEQLAPHVWALEIKPGGAMEIVE